MVLVHIVLWLWRRSTFGLDCQTFVTETTPGSCKKPTLIPGFLCFTVGIFVTCHRKPCFRNILGDEIWGPLSHRVTGCREVNSIYSAGLGNRACIDEARVVHSDSNVDIRCHMNKTPLSSAEFDIMLSCPI
jgi:hypothetical protein